MKGPSLQLLITQLTCGDDQTAEETAQAITALGDTALPALFGLLDSVDAEMRWWALRTLANIKHPSVPQQLCRGLQDSDLEVRQCAALGLSQQPWSGAVPDLVRALTDNDPMLARLSGDALIASGSAAVPVLIEVVKNGSAGAQIEAVRSLALIGDKQAIPTLFHVWQDGSPLVRHWAEEGFERMGVGMAFFSPE